MKTFGFTLPAVSLLLLAASPGALAEEVVATGAFTGLSQHETTGTVSIVKTDAGGYTIVLEDDFTFDGAPDPKLGFGTSGNYDLQTTFSELAKNSGKQTYILPEGIDPADYDEFYVWCEKFAVPLGVASLN